MNDRKLPIQSDIYAEDSQPYQSKIFSNKHAKKAINLRNRYEILLDKINTEIHRQNIQINQYDDDNSDNSMENQSQLYSSSITLNENEKSSKEENQQNIYNSNHYLGAIKQKEESIDDYIQNLLSELSQWNETWEKCILMATKVIKYHTISAQNGDQQRTVLIDIVQRLCGSIIAETECIDNSYSNVNYSKYRELVEKRKKDKQRLRKMQQRCEKLFVEVQKNREMIESISQNNRNRLKSSSNDETLSMDNFLATLIDKHQQQNIEKRKKEENIQNLKRHQIKNEEKFKKEMKNLHKKDKKRNRSKNISKSDFNVSDNNSNHKNYTNSNNDTSFSSQSHHKKENSKLITKNSNNSINYYDTNNTYEYNYYHSDYSYDNDFDDSDDSEPDSMLYSNFDKQNINSDKKSSSMLYSKYDKTNTNSDKNSDSKFDRNENNFDSHATNREKLNVDNKKYSNNLKKMITLVNNLEKSCNQMQTNLDNQLSANNKAGKSEQSSSSYQSSFHGNQDQTQINGNELSLESLEKMHLSLAEAERNFSTS